MNESRIITLTEDYVKKLLEGEKSGHDYYHVERVRKNALRIFRGEKKGDIFIIQLGALLHDVADWKSHDEEEGPQKAKDWLLAHKLHSDTIAHIEYIIRTISFKGRCHNIKPKTIEAQIVQDADRLDSIGAIGIARCFTYGGSKGKPIYIPGEIPQDYESVEEYKNSGNCSINHFYEKLLLVKDLMNTQTAKK